MIAALSLDLSAILTVEPNLGPQLHMDRPDLASIGPNDAFALFSALRAALDEDLVAEEREVAGFHAILSGLSGPDQKGLLVLGRRGNPWTPDESQAVGRFARAFSRAFSAQAPTDPGRSPAPQVVRLSIDSSQDLALAAVTLSSGGQILRAAAEHPSAMRAVGEATLAALGDLAAGRKLVDMSDGEIGGARVVLVLLLDENGASSVGSCLVDATPDTLHAAASATLSAALHR